MSPELEQRVDAILQEAMELVPTERAAYLERACASESPTVRAEIASLLGHIVRTVEDGFLATPVSPLRYAGNLDPALHANEAAGEVGSTVRRPSDDAEMT